LRFPACRDLRTFVMTCRRGLGHAGKNRPGPAAEKGPIGAIHPRDKDANTRESSVVATYDATPRTRPPATTPSRSSRAIPDNEATLTVTGDRKLNIFVPANPAFTTAYSGWVNADTSSVPSSDLLPLPTPGRIVRSARAPSLAIGIPVVQLRLASDGGTLKVVYELSAFRQLFGSAAHNPGASPHAGTSGRGAPYPPRSSCSGTSRARLSG
jgi:hypothetical protein